MTNGRWERVGTTKLGRGGHHDAFRRFCDKLDRKGVVSRETVTIDGTEHTIYVWDTNFAWEPLTEGDEEAAIWEFVPANA